MHMVANNFIDIHKPAEITIPLLRRHLQAPDESAITVMKASRPRMVQAPFTNNSDQLQEIIKKTYFGWVTWHFFESPNPNPLFFDMHPDLLRMGRR